MPGRVFIEGLFAFQWRRVTGRIMGIHVDLAKESHGRLDNGLLMDVPGIQWK